MPGDPLADNLRRLRAAAGLTQAELASRANIPRATLGSMEQPGSNPGIQSVQAVARALGLGLDELIQPRPDERHFLVGPKEQQDYRADAGRFSARLVSPIASKGVHMHRVVMQPGCHSPGRPHPPGAQEFFLCLVGVAVIEIEGEAVEVPAGHLLQFPGHRRHVYRNRGEVVCEAVSAVVMHLG
jgi:XRE family transcriptional regulator, regulator of sulfur utilization